MKYLLLSLLCLFSLHSALGQLLIPFQKNGLYGYKDRMEKTVVPARYENTWRLWRSTFKVVKKNGRVGLIDARGNLRIPLYYDALYDIHHKKWITARLGKYSGVLDTNGNTLVPFDYEQAFFCYGQSPLIMAQKMGKWGVLDTLGQVVIPFEYKHLGYGFSEGLMAAAKEDKYGFIDIRNTLQIPYQYEEADDFSEGLAYVGDYTHSGYINRHNDTIIPFDYQFRTFQSEFDRGWALVRQGYQEGYIDSSNRVRIPLRYSSLGKFHDGFATVSIGDRNNYRIWEYGYIDSSGKEYLYPHPNPQGGFSVQVPPAPKHLPKYAHLLKKNKATDQAWTLESLLEHALKAFRLEPVTYPDLDNLSQICISYGWLIGEGNYSGDFMFEEGWEEFKKKTLFPIFSSETLRQLAWDWMKPLYKEQFITMNPFEKKAYRETAEYLRTYINTYDRKKTEHFLDTDEARFAYYNTDGQLDKHRKISAFVDRLILIHHLVSEDEARRWINTLADEVATW